jgi:hypothetical protein
MSLTLVSTQDVAAAIDRCREIVLTAYTLGPGSVLDALERAGDRGAKVRVVLDAAPLDDSHGGADGPQAHNAAAVSALRRHGVDAVTTRAGEPVLHLKSALVDGVAFLDDRNWPDRGANTVLRDDRPGDLTALRSLHAGARGPAPISTETLAVTKRAALAMEARVVTAGADVVVETESFGGSKVSAALREMARHPDHPRMRLIVADREYATNAKERKLLASIAAAGVEVRVGAADEKMAAAGSHAWLGSTNATATFYDKERKIDLGAQRDWGTHIEEPGLVTALRERFERNWSAAVPLADMRA